MPLPDPPLDDQRNVLPHDCAQIEAQDVVIRRVSELQIKRGRISSILYKKSNPSANDPNPGMSVDIEKLITEAGIDPVRYVTTPRWIGSVYFRAEDLRGMGFVVGPHPIASPPLPYHGQVWGEFNEGQREDLRNKAEWYVEVPNCNLREE